LDRDIAHEAAAFAVERSSAEPAAGVHAPGSGYQGSYSLIGAVSFEDILLHG